MIIVVALLLEASILKYVNDENPEPINFIIEMTFEPIKLQLKRDLIKYEQKREKNKQNANMRWNNASGNQKMQCNATACDGTNRNANDAVIDIDNDIDIHSTSVKTAYYKEKLSCRCESCPIHTESYTINI